jgi:hypothetical protein
MTSPYRQTSYDLPFNGAVAPGGVGSSLSDDFSNSRPAYLDGADAVVPGFCELQEKWNTWDPGDVLQFDGVDARLQMALLQSTGLKQWAGKFQQIPLPTAIGESVDYHFYARLMLAQAADTDASPDIGPFQICLFVGDNLLTNPEAGGFFAVGIEAQRTDSPPSSSYGNVIAVTYAAYNSIGNQRSSGQEGPWPSCTYFRIRLRQTRDTEFQYTSLLACEFGVTGVDWMPLVTMEPSINATPIYQSVGLALNGMGSQVGGYFDFFRAVPQSYSDLAPGIGGTQPLGAV